MSLSIWDIAAQLDARGDGGEAFVRWHDLSDFMKRDIASKIDAGEIAVDDLTPDTLYDFVRNDRAAQTGVAMLAERDADRARVREQIRRGMACLTTAEARIATAIEKRNAAEAQVKADAAQEKVDAATAARAQGAIDGSVSVRKRVAYRRSLVKEVADRLVKGDPALRSNRNRLTNTVLAELKEYGDPNNSVRRVDTTGRVELDEKPVRLTHTTTYRDLAALGF